METDDYYVYLQPIYNIIMAETLLLTSAMRHPAGERQLTILEIRRCLSVKNHPFFFYFIEFIYLCHRFHILHPRCTQGVPKVYPRYSQGVAKVKRLSLPWENTEYCVDKVWGERRKKSVGKK